MATKATLEYMESQIQNLKVAMLQAELNMIKKIPVDRSSVDYNYEYLRSEIKILLSNLNM